MTVTTARQPAPDVDEMTTADWAGMAATGNWGKPNPAPATQEEADNTEQPASTTVPDAGTSRAASAKTIEPPTKAPSAKQKSRRAAGRSDDETRRSYLLDAANWTPEDFAAISPAALRELVAEHSQRSQAMDAGLGRFGYALYAPTVTALGVALNVVSWTTAKLSALLNDPRNAQRPGSLEETISLHTDRANNIRFTLLKVLYSFYAVPATASSVVLNTVCWLASHTAVALNDPKRIGRVVLGLLFVALVVGGTSVML